MNRQFHLSLPVGIAWHCLGKKRYFAAGLLQCKFDCQIFEVIGVFAIDDSTCQR